MISKRNSLDSAPVLPILGPEPPPGGLNARRRNGCGCGSTECYLERPCGAAEDQIKSKFDPSFGDQNVESNL